MKNRFLIALCFFFCAISMAWCMEHEYRYQRADGKEGRIVLIANTDSTSVLQYWRGDSLASTWPINCQVFQFHCADLTGNGVPDIALGVIHQSRYARYRSKRIWLLKLYDEDVIRPLWLSSRLTHNLIDFEIEPPISSSGKTKKAPQSIIHTWEQTLQGDTVEGRYRHKGFGVVHL